MRPTAFPLALRDTYVARDRGGAALRRAVRSAVVQPGAFALALKVLHEPAAALFAAFGSFALLLFVEFQGPARDRLRSQAGLIIAAAVLSCLGTLCSRSDVLAVAAMTIVGVLILFSAVVSSVLAGATQSLLLSFILSVALPAPPSAIGSHLLGWGLAGGLSLLAVIVLPAPSTDPLRAPVLAVLERLAACLRAGVRARDTRASLREAVGVLSRAFLAAPYRPTGLTTGARAGVRLVDELRWMGQILLADGDPLDPRLAPAVERVRGATLSVLEAAAGALGAGGAGELAKARGALREANRALPGEVAAGMCAGAGLVTALDPAFKVSELAFMADEIAGNVAVVVAADERGWLARALGRQPGGFEGRLASARERAQAHLSLRSASARNALRGGAALGLAIVIARATGVQHAFWVSLGALSILRSNALSTGQTLARAIAGTVVGLLVGAAVVALVGTDRTLLWTLLPVAVLIAGVAPAAISFTAGQAAFTLLLFIVFDLIAPATYRLGVVRVEDVALGGATSLLVGLLFWPRGAGAALGRALADAYTASAAYLGATVSYAVACCAPGMTGGGPRPQAREAAAANRRLDDTFRSYLAERGAKRLALAGVASLVEGASTLRLSADAVAELWHGEAEPSRSRIAAARELSAQVGGLASWYERFGESLAHAAPLRETLEGDPAAAARLTATVRDDLTSADPVRADAAVRVLWTGDHLDAARRLGSQLVAAGRDTEPD